MIRRLVSLMVQIVISFSLLRMLHGPPVMLIHVMFTMDHKMGEVHQLVTRLPGDIPYSSILYIDLEAVQRIMDLPLMEGSIARLMPAKGSV